MKPLITNLLRDDQGQDLIEYALLVAFLSIAVVGFGVGVRGGLLGVASTAGSRLTTASTGAAS
jgi:Flp pilus assembly pilin Flp